MNFSKLKKAITDIGLNKVCGFLENGYIEDYDYEQDGDDVDEDEDEEKKEKRDAEIKAKIEALNLVLVHEVGGSSGDGESVERVFMHKDVQKNGTELVYIRLTGFYSSYEGTSWDDDIERVQPEVITATIYTKYKN